MGRSILKKLKSNKGASLTFALLAFLVCAVISAVLLASASAATGRLSNLAETDQRYYAVTSAAQLFCDTLENQEFTIRRTKTSYDVSVRGYMTANGITYGYNATEDEIITWFGRDVYSKKTDSDSYTFNVGGMETIYDGDDVNGIREISLLADAAMHYVLGVPIKDESGKMTKYSAEQAFEREDLPGSPFKVNNDAGTLVSVDQIAFGTYHLEYKKNDTEQAKEAPAVTVYATLRKDGSIVFEFSNNDDPTKPAYKVSVTLTAEVQDDSALPLTTSSDSYAFRFDPGTVSGASPRSYECTVTTTVKTKTTTIRWNVTEIKKGAA